MKVNYIEKNKYIYFLSTKKKLDGIYHYSDPEEEDSGWNNMSHYLFYRDGVFVWQISYSGQNYVIFNGYDPSNPISKNLNLDEFLELLRKEAPETTNWILFNLEQIMGVKNDYGHFS